MAMLGVGTARSRTVGRHVDAGEHFTLGQGCREQVDEALAGGNVARAAGAGGRQRAAQGDDDGRQVGGRIGVGHRAADRAAVAHLLVADQAGGLCQDGAVLANHLRGGQRGMGRGCADAQHLPVQRDAAQLGHAPNVHQRRRLADAELHLRQQAVSTRQQLGAGMGAHELDRFGHRGSPVVFKFGGVHGLSPD